MQALVEEQTRQVRVAEQQRQMEERQKLQQAMFQVTTAFLQPFTSPCMLVLRLWGPLELNFVV